MTSTLTMTDINNIADSIVRDYCLTSTPTRSQIDGWVWDYFASIAPDHCDPTRTDMLRIRTRIESSLAN